MGNPRPQPYGLETQRELQGVEPSLHAKALSLAGGFAFELGEDGHLDFADRAALAEFLRTPSSELNTGLSDWASRLSSEAEQQRREAIASLSDERDRYQIDYVLEDGDGHPRSVREIGEALACADGRATFIRGVLLDKMEATGQDSLTGLPHQARLEEAGTLLAALGERIGISVHMLRLRLKNLDALCDHYGEDVRAALLQQVAQRLQKSLRSPDMVSRSDGSDFIAITLNSDPDTLGLRLRAAVTAQTYETPRGQLALEVDVVRAPLHSVQEALDRTVAKLLGVPEVSRAEAAVWPDVDTTIAENRLSLVFQPIVHATKNTLHHFEALLRYKTDDGSIQSAFAFISEAETRGDVHTLDRYVLDKAASLLRDDPSLHLAINVSAGTVGNPDHSAAYVDALSELGAVSNRLILELTETLAIDDPALASRFSANVRELGCQFAVDDFASGHTSFRNLLAVEADAIKMDGSLVRGVALDENKQAFIRVMVDLAATFNVETVAEMVEDRADAEMLSRLGVTYLQGYYFGRPSAEPIWSFPSDPA